VTPYIGLQLKAIAHTFELITGWQSPEAMGDVAFWAAGMLCIFAMLFGARSLSPTERHEGLVVAVAFESAVKLIAFILLGVYITWGVGGGLSDLVLRAVDDPRTASLFVLGGPDGSSVNEWLTLCVLSASAVVLLPRQFHVIAVENQDKAHVKRASWGVPLYLILINLLVIPVALVGVLGGVEGGADYFLLNIPLLEGNRTMALLAFIGGFSAATSMVIVSSVALSTVISHHIIVPTFFKSFGEKELSRPLLLAKRAAIAFVIFLGYASYRWIGDSHTLVSTGLLSFSAVFQFAPAVVLTGATPLCGAWSSTSAVA
jgi:Na+/proline symporter